MNNTGQFSGNPAWRRGVAAAAGLLSCLAASDALATALSTRTVHLERPRVATCVFDAAEVLASRDVPRRPAVVFDQKRLTAVLPTLHRDTWPSRRLSIVRPDDGAAFPPNSAPPRFCWEDEINSVWMLVLDLPGAQSPLRVVTRQREWRPTPRRWRAIVERAREGWIEFEIRGCRAPTRTQREGPLVVDRRRFRISAVGVDPVLVHCLASPVLHRREIPDVQARRMDNADARVLIPVTDRFQTLRYAFAPGRSGDQPGPLAVIQRAICADEYRLGVYDFAARRGRAFAVRAGAVAWHPGGNKLAVDSAPNGLLDPLITLEYQPLQMRHSDILIVDALTGSLVPLPGASDPEFLEIAPTWAPDGESLVFARAAVPRDAPNPDRARFDLYRVPWNDGRGGIATPVPDASMNGGTNLDPKFSPDGKWLVFVHAGRGPALQPAADLWIVPVHDRAPARRLECSADRAMDAQPCWSTNSRWLAFASTRDDGIYARIYLAEIDATGRAAPPVELPVPDPPLLSFGLPEFLPAEPVVDPQRWSSLRTAPSVETELILHRGQE